MASNTFPVPSFYFDVSIGGTNIAFQEVSGLQATIVYKQEDREGNDTVTQHKVFDKIEHGKVTFKKGLAKNGTIALKLIRDKFNVHFSKATTAATVQHRDVLISLMNEKGETAMMINLVGAYPVGWQISNFDAMSKELSIETMELEYQSLIIS